MSLDLEDRHYKILISILKKYPYSFYAFGSRVKGTARPLSDLDLAVLEDMPSNVLSHIDGDFEESDLPFKVDVISLSKISPSFHKIIEKDLLLIQ